MQPIPLGVYIALSIQLGGLSLFAQGITLQDGGKIWIGIAVFFVGSAILFFDFRDRARAKGWPSWMGLTCVLNLVGLMIVFILPVYKKREERGFEVVQGPPDGDKGSK